jgi:hypothetical protein
MLTYGRHVKQEGTKTDMEINGIPLPAYAGVRPVECRCGELAHYVGYSNSGNLFLCVNGHQTSVDHEKSAAK